MKLGAFIVYLDYNLKKINSDSYNKIAPQTFVVI